MFLKRLFTKNLKEIPLFRVDFNYQLYKQFGKIGSCKVHEHPLLLYDEHVRTTINELIEYIRENYDMNEM